MEPRRHPRDERVQNASQHPTCSTPQDNALQLVFVAHRLAYYCGLSHIRGLLLWGMMTDLLTVQKMHSFRPVFAFPPCAPHPGHRSTPVTLDDWIHIALVGCHVPASAFQSTAAVHPTGTFLTGSDAIAANNCASAYEQTAIRARTPPGGGIGTRQILIYMRSLQLMLRSYRTSSR